MWLGSCLLVLMLGSPSVDPAPGSGPEPQVTPAQSAAGFESAAGAAETAAGQAAEAVPPPVAEETEIPALPPAPAPPPIPSAGRHPSRSGSRTLDRVRAMARSGAAGRFPVPRLVPCSQPLYFEDSNLERTGRSAGPVVQPLLSGVHFFGSVGIWPLKVARACPGSLVCPNAERELIPVWVGRNLFSPAPGFERCD